MGKLPGFLFYPGDWMKDPALRAVSSGARGLWMDMLCLMFESDRRGYLQLNGKPVTAEMLARMTGVSTGDVSRYLQELDDSGVFSSTEHGVVFSRRMVREEREREQARGRKKKQRSRDKPDGHDDVTGDVTPLSVNETVPLKEVNAFEFRNKTEEKCVREVRHDDVTPDVTVTPDLPPLQLARGLLEQISLTVTQTNLIAVESAIRMVAHAKHLPFPAAHDWLLAKAEEAIQRGETVNRFWFEDGLQRWDTSKATTKKNCQRHPGSGLTEWGTCWGCYAEEGAHSGRSQTGGMGE